MDSRWSLSSGSPSARPVGGNDGKKRTCVRYSNSRTRSLSRFTASNPAVFSKYPSTDP